MVLQRVLNVYSLTKSLLFVTAVDEHLVYMTVPHELSDRGSINETKWEICINPLMAVPARAH